MSVLENHSDPSFFWFCVDIAAGVKKNMVIQPDMTNVGRGKTGKEVHKCRFAAAGGAEYPGPAGRKRKGAIKPKVPDIFFQLYIKFHGLSLSQSFGYGFTRQQYHK